MSNFHGAGKKHSYFEGWYFKQSGEDGTVAFIPSYHVDDAGKKWASLQVITEKSAFGSDFSVQEFSAAQSRFLVEIGGSRFSKTGCRLEYKSREHAVTGILNYENRKRPRYDIMGPFALLPFMECRHKVVSLLHRVNGQLEIDGEKYQFRQGVGYIEGDRGRSFPKGYCWTQCCWDEGSIMLSIADIPFMGGSFQGCIGFVYLGSKEYRLATYLGVKLCKVSKDEIRVRQGSIEVTVRPLEKDAKPLKAPKDGSMDRVIHESLASTVYYEVRKNGKTILEHYSRTASFEWDMPEKL